MSDPLAAAEALIRAHGPEGALQAATDRVARLEEGRASWLRVVEAVKQLATANPGERR